MKTKIRNLNIGQYRIQGDRESQQDSYLLGYSKDNNLILAAVCDGMGGMAGGEKASQTVSKVLEDFFRGDPPESVDRFSEWMQDALITADREVASLVNEKGEPLGAGSTCVMVLTDEAHFLWASVGDSRIILLRNGKIYTLTRMHNYFLQLNEMLKTGIIGVEEYERQAPRGEALISYLGIGNLSLIDVSAQQVNWVDSDVLIICSDGLYKALNDEQIQAIVEESGQNMNVAAKRLCMEAHRLSKKKQDNTTVILLGFQRGD